MTSKRKSTKSPWSYYEKSNDVGICQFKNCSKKIKAKGGSTSGLHSHLKTEHNIDLFDDSNKKHFPIADIQLKNTRNLIENYISPLFERSTEAIISRLVVLDGIAFKRIAESYDIRYLINKQDKDNLPKSATTIKKIVVEFSNKIKSNLIKLFADMITKKIKFALTTDEWTSIRNRRYININLHTENDFWNLGIARIYSKADSEGLLKIINIKLNEFGLNLKNIISLTTDGAAVMKKLVRMTGLIQQECQAHGIHLAISNILYCRKKNNAKRNLNFMKNIVQGSKESYDDEQVMIEEIDSTDSDEFDLKAEPNTIELEFIPEIDKILAKIRKVYTTFRKSSVKNDMVLQKYVKETFNKEIELIIDVSIRWNSLYCMLERFLLLYDCIRKALIDMNIEIIFSNNEIQFIKELLIILCPIRDTVEVICSRNINLYQVDIAFEHMILEISKSEHKIANDLKTEIIEKITQRRTIYSDILYFLTDPNYLYKNRLFGIQGSEIYIKTEILQTLTQLALDIFKGDLIDDCLVKKENEVNSFKLNSEKNMTFKEQLINRIIYKNTNINNKNDNEISDEKKISNAIAQEVETFLSFGTLGNLLKKIHEILSSIKPTSVESERAFSSAGLFVTKIRSRLGDDSIDSLCFLKSYLMNLKNS